MRRTKADHFVETKSQHRAPPPIYPWGWSGGATVLGKLPVPGRPTNLERVGQGPSVLAVGAGGGCMDIFSLVYHFSFFLPLSGRRPDID